MIIPGFALRHAQTVASCASASVKSHFSSNKAIPRRRRVVSTLLRYSFFTLCSWLGCLTLAHCDDVPFDGQTHPARNDFVGWESSTTQLKKKKTSGLQKDSVTCFPDPTLCLGTSPRVATCLSGTLSGLINQLEAGLLVLAFQMPQHVQRHGVSSSPMGTMFASTPSKLTRSTSRTSHPSRLSPEVVLTSSIPNIGSAVASPASSCSRVRVDKKGVRSRPVASLWTQALCDCLASSSNPGPPWSRECAATGSRTARIVRSTSHFCFPSGSHSVDDRSRSAPSSTGFSGCLSVMLCRAPTEPPEDSQHCSCPSFLIASVAAVQAGCPPIVPWGSKSEIPEPVYRRMPHIARTASSVRDVSTV